MTFSFAGSQYSLSRPFPQAPADEKTKAFNPSNDGLSFFEEGTNGKAIMLVHGMSGAPAEMRLVARQFSRRGYSVFAPCSPDTGVGKPPCGVPALKTGSTASRSPQTGWQHEATPSFPPAFALAESFRCSRRICKRPRSSRSRSTHPVSTTMAGMFRAITRSCHRTSDGSG